MPIWRINREPTGPSYSALIRFVALGCDRFSVYTTGMALSERATATLALLEPMQLAMRDTSVVPGSVLPFGTVRLREYDLTPESLSVVINATDRLYGWAEPNLPNDLSLLAGEREVLVVLASDREATLEATDDEIEDLARTAPALRMTPA